MLGGLIPRAIYYGKSPNEVATNSINSTICEEMNAQLTLDFKVWEV